MSTTPDSMVELQAGSLAVRIDVDRGAQISRIGRGPTENVLAWFDGPAPLPASRSASYGSTTLDWLSEYRGGWQELFANGGAECVVDGVPLPFHGEASAARWDVVERSADACRLQVASRLPLLLERRMRLVGEPTILLLEETVHSLAATELSFFWGHHPAFETVDGGRLDLPDCRVHVDRGLDTPLVDVRPGGEGRWPSVPGRDDGDHVDLRPLATRPLQRLVYLSDLTEGWCALRHPARASVAMAWDVAAFPHAWLWQEIGGAGFPWYGRARITAVEPVSSWPATGLADAIERGVACRIAPGSTVSAWLTVRLFDDDGRVVRGVDRDGRLALG